jgi:hypothetical protein
VNCSVPPAKPHHNSILNRVAPKPLSHCSACMHAYNQARLAVRRVVLGLRLPCVCARRTFPPSCQIRYTGRGVYWTFIHSVRCEPAGAHSLASTLGYNPPLYV